MKDRMWLRKWRFKPNVLKSLHITFTLKKDVCPQVFLDNANLPQVTMVKYLGLHLDSRLTRKTHILMKTNQLLIRLRELMWLIDKNSKMSLENKILIYKAILKLVCTYGYKYGEWPHNQTLTSFSVFSQSSLG